MYISIWYGLSLVSRTSPFFCNTQPDFVIELANSAVDRIFMPGDLVVTEGEVGNSMYILLNGSADVYVSNPKEKDAKMLRYVLRIIKVLESH